MDLVSVIAGLATQIMKFVNTEAVNARANKIASLHQQHQNEIAKGQGADDGLIERLEFEIANEGNALLVELASKGAAS